MYFCTPYTKILVLVSYFVYGSVITMPLVARGLKSTTEITMYQYIIFVLVSQLIDLVFIYTYNIGILCTDSEDSGVPGRGLSGGGADKG